MSKWLQPKKHCNLGCAKEGIFQRDLDPGLIFPESWWCNCGGSNWGYNQQCKHSVHKKGKPWENCVCFFPQKSGDVPNKQSDCIKFQEFSIMCFHSWRWVCAGSTLARHFFGGWKSNKDCRAASFGSSTQRSKCRDPAETQIRSLESIRFGEIQHLKMARFRSVSMFLRSTPKKRREFKLVVTFLCWDLKRHFPIGIGFRHAKASYFPTVIIYYPYWWISDHLHLHVNTYLYNHI